MNNQHHDNHNDSERNVAGHPKNLREAERAGQDWSHATGAGAFLGVSSGRDDAPMKEGLSLGPIGQLATALAKAQEGIRSAAKTSVNPHYGSRYADLASVWAACRESLTRNGLSVVQMPNYDPNDGCVSVTTILLHTSREYILSTARAPITKADPQAVGSAITYLRRYALAAFVGVAPDDDDGEAASHPSESHAEEVVHETTTPQLAPVPVWPMGKSKGKPLGKLTDDELEQGRQWCVDRDTKKYARLIQQIDAELSVRESGDIEMAS